jgi:hypothetical protein
MVEGGNKREKMVSLQERDKRLLQLCYEQQFLLSELVADHFFSSFKEATRRMRELEQADYFETRQHPEHAQKKFFRLTKKGARVASERSNVDVGLRWSPHYLEHDSAIMAVRLAVEKRWDGLWVPERAIRGFRPGEVPDGLFIFPDGAKLAIEVENSLKGRTRFEDRLRRWKDIAVKIVLYVTTKPEVHDRLRVFLDAAPRPPLFCLTRLQELGKAEPEVWSPLGEIDLFARRTL